MNSPSYMRFIFWGKKMNQVGLRIQKENENKVLELMKQSTEYELMNPEKKAKLFIKYRIQNVRDYQAHLLREQNIEFEFVDFKDFVVEYYQ